ncbi:CWC16 protein [Macleaya cordata]|uniref:CWC16 protein n=1 Tax=Macleaya cordata TaxID=56857 RepID=A0A200QDB1_MACCD|nr:CWC16 protein [Macleaya cordata]
MKVRTMLSMSIRCKTCGNYMYKGTKFNVMKEKVGERYLGIEIFQFYYKCTKCSAEFTIKTDPRNSDYVVESGVTRNFEPWRKKDEEAGEEKKKRDAEEMGNAMKSLENRMQDSRREMNRDAALGELMSMKSRHANVCADEVLEALQRAAEEKKKQEAAEYKAIAASVFRKKRDFVVTIPDEDVEDEDEDGDGAGDLHQLLNRSGETENCNFKRKKVSKDLLGKNPTDYLTMVSYSDSSNNNANSNEPKSIFKSSSSRVMIKKKTPTTSTGKNQVRREENNQGREPKAKDTITKSTGLQSIQNYESDDESG